MFTFSIHGLGGQGVESCTKILGTSGFLSKMEVQDLIVNPIENRGNVVSGYVKMSKDEIISKEIPEEFDFTLVLDPKISLTEIIKQCKNNSIMIINSPNKITVKKGVKPYNIDAVKIILEKNISETAMPMLGAFTKIYPKISIKTIKDVAKSFGLKENEISAIDLGFKEVK